MKSKSFLNDVLSPWGDMILTPKYIHTVGGKYGVRGTVEDQRLLVGSGTEGSLRVSLTNTN